MARAQKTDKQSSMLSQELLLSVAEQIKLPLLQIARLAELGRTDRVQATADSALSLIDNYVLAVRLNLEAQQQPLKLESVSVSSVLYDAAARLSDYAQGYGISLELNVASHHGTVMAHRQGLEAALVSLGLALIESLPAQESPQLTLQLATHRCRYGVVAGLYTDTERLTPTVLSRGRQLHGRSRQPLLNLTQGSGAGVFVADSLLRAMDLELTVSRHQRLFGLGAILQPNQQLQLV
ncbi:MAG: hypothetical protein ABIV43_02160 [Candidatus Saccharimonadales bacterium]